MYAVIENPYNLRYIIIDTNLVQDGYKKITDLVEVCRMLRYTGYDY